jgi:hypothetical protein
VREQPNFPVHVVPEHLTVGSDIDTMLVVSKDLDELLERMRSNPSDVRVTDACEVVSAFFGAPRQEGTSHRVWKMPWPGDPRVNLQRGKGGKAKAYQIRQALQAIDRLLGQRAVEARQRAKEIKKN